MLVLKQCLTMGTRPLVRSFSAAANLVNVNVDNKGIAIVELNRPPVNALNYELLEAMHRTFVQLETDRIKGMILTSTSATVFSGGLDFLEMYKPTVEKARKFWGMLQNMWIKLYGSSFATVAVMNGHSPAAGCLLGLSCEYRIIVPKVKVGLNETQLGANAPLWFQDCMRNIIGERQAEKALISGTMFSSEEALQVGLVDEIAPNKEECIKQAYKYLDTQLNLPSLVRRTIKLQLRKETLSRVINGREADTTMCLDYIFQPEVQESLEKYLQSLKNKSR